MAKRSEGGGRDIVKHTAPAHLQKYMENDTSLEATKEYRVLPRLKVIQGTTKKDLQDKFGVGSVILSPGEAEVAHINKDHSAPFYFVPLIFFVEFLQFSDIKDVASNTIVGRSFDPTSEIAKKSRNKDTRSEGYGEQNKKGGHQYEYKFVESLNFPGFIYGPEEHPLKGQLATLAFKSGEFGTGTNFISTLNIRKHPLWSRIFECSTSFRERGANSWWGIDCKPTELYPDSVINESETEFFYTSHKELQEGLEKKLLVVDHSEEKQEEGATEAVGDEKAPY